MLVNLEMRGRVAIERVARASHMPNVLFSVGAADLFVAGIQRRCPFQFKVGLRAKLLQCAADARGSFGMTGRGIARATFISDDRHGGTLNSGDKTSSFETQPRSKSGEQILFQT